MEIKVIHCTKDLYDPNIDVTSNDQRIDSMLTLGGRQAGICYMADNYLSDKINNSEAALKRANTILGTGHHSPFDHATIGLEITGIPKIMAMILNSVEFYTTSEKSARYTVMHPETQLELDTYNKWIGIFKVKISEYLTEQGKTATFKEIEKLALENARYMISVFTPTTMGYTTTFRQFSYMVQWFDGLIRELEKRPNSFNTKLIPYCKELRDFFYEITKNAVHDHKNGKFMFLPAQYGRDIPRAEIISDVYQINYFASFAQLAQEHRHRTLHYEMMFTGEPGEFGCYVPKIIRGTEYEKEWLDDFDKLADQYPQCTLVKVLEQGTAHNFFLKCKERLCGRAQLEIADQTVDTLEHFLMNRENLSESNIEELRQITDNFRLVPKCGFPGYMCQEPCRWGRSQGVDRLI